MIIILTNYEVIGLVFDIPDQYQGRAGWETVQPSSVLFYNQPSCLTQPVPCIHSV